MMSLQQSILNGTLNEKAIDEMIGDEKAKIDQLSDKGYTALALAAARGQEDYVKLLIKKGADVKKKCYNGQTALCFAAEKATNNRAAIMSLLLGAGADIDETCPAFKNNTPLMLAIMEHPDDLKSIQLLVANRASLSIKNSYQKNAIDIATEVEPAVLDSLQPRSARAGFKYIIQMIVSLLLYVLGWITNGIGGVRRRLSSPDASTKIEIDNIINKNDDGQNCDQEKAVSAEDFMRNIDETIHNMGLDRFFSKNRKFLQTVAEKAVELKNNPSTNLGSFENIGKLTTFSMYQPVIYLDDSGSMNNDGRFEKQADLVRRVSRIASYLVPEDLGVAVHFINNDTPQTTKLREDDVMELISKLVPDGATELGYNLRHKILTPLLYDVVENGEELYRPLLITIITDGCPDGLKEEEGEFIRVLKECSTFLFQKNYPQTAVRFQISQIGSDDDVADFFESLKAEGQIQSMIYCTSDQLDDKYQEMRDNDKGLEEWAS